MNKSQESPLSAREIEQHVAYIAGKLDHLGASDADVARFAEVGERFGLLRSQYQARPESLNGYLPKLSQLRRQFDALIECRLPQVVDRYHEVTEQIRRAESEKAFWREFLISKVGSGPRENLSGTTADATIRSSRSRLLPAVGTEPRARLDRLVQEAGHWQEVSQLSRTKLQRALEESRFSTTQQQAISDLCPSKVVHQVTSRPRNT